MFCDAKFLSRCMTDHNDEFLFQDAGITQPVQIERVYEEFEPAYEPRSKQK